MAIRHKINKVTKHTLTQEQDRSKIKSFLFGMAALITTLAFNALSNDNYDFAKEANMIIGPTGFLAAISLFLGMLKSTSNVASLEIAKKYPKPHKIQNIENGLIEERRTYSKKTISTGALALAAAMAFSGLSQGNIPDSVALINIISGSLSIVIASSHLREMLKSVIEAAVLSQIREDLIRLDESESRTFPKKVRGL